MAASGVGDIGEYAEVLRSPAQLRHSFIGLSGCMTSGPSGNGLSWSTTAALKPMESGDALRLKALRTASRFTLTS